MGNEIIFYYVTEETVTGCSQPLKIPFWRKIRPDSFVVEKEEMTIVTFLIPRLQKEWKAEKLLRLIQESAEAHPLYFRGVRILIQPEVQNLLTEGARKEQNISEAAGARERIARNDALLSLCLPLSEKILRGRFSVLNKMPESVVLLMGTFFFPEEQVKHFAEMIGPYLPQINALTILYEGEEDGQIGGDFQVIQEYTDGLYYEYGLVSRIICGTEAVAGRSAHWYGQSPSLFLDYGYSGKLPFPMLKGGGFYLDVVSSGEKEALFRRKYRGIFYQSPRKYLDTMIKSGYDN